MSIRRERKKERKMGCRSAEQKKSEKLDPSPTNLNKVCLFAHQEQVGTKKANGQQNIYLLDYKETTLITTTR